jgi:hypothetical protein
MTQQPLPLKRPTLTDQLEAYFRAHPNEIVTARTIADLVGVSGSRQRRLEVEKRGLYLERHAWRTRDGRHHLGWAYLPMLSSSGDTGRAA